MADPPIISVEPCTGPFYEDLRRSPPLVQRVRSVLPVAFRWAARAIEMPGAGGASVMAVLLASVAEPGREDERDALEYMVRAERADLIRGGMPEPIADAVLALAATREGADAVYELVPAPTAETPDPPAD